jgi:hypothetical protein
MTRYMPNPLQRYQKASHMWSRMQQDNESVDSYFTAILSAANQIKLRDEQQLCFCLIRGLKPHLRLHVLQNSHDTLEEIQHSVRVAEIASAGIVDNDKAVSELSKTVTLLVDRLTAKQAATHPPAAPVVAAVTSDRGGTDRQPDRQRYTSSYNRRGQTGRQPPPPRQQYQRRFGYQSQDRIAFEQEPPACDNCLLSHEANRCPAFAQTCYNCNRQNHFARACRSRPQQQHRYNQHKGCEPASPQSRRLGSIDAQSGPQNFILASLNYVNLRLIVDSGASFCCITESTFKRIVARNGNSRLKVTPLTDNIRLSSATGSPLHIIGEVMLDIRLQYHLIPQKFLVIRNLHHSGVIGMDCLQDCKAVTNLSEQTLHLFDSLIVAPLITATDHANALCLMQTVRIPGHTEAVLPVTLARHAPYRGHDPAITEAWPGITNRGIGIAKALVQPQNTRTICRILNVNSTPQILRRGTRIAYLSPIDASDPFNVAALRGDQIRNAAYLAAIDAQQDSSKTTLTQEDKIKAISELGLKLDAARKRLKEHEFDELVSLLYEYKHLFITDDADIPLANLPPVTIPLLHDRPVRIKPYKLPPLMDAELNRQLSKLCHSGILEPSCSPYSSPVFLVRKPNPPGAHPQTGNKTGNETGNGNIWQIVTDMRQINLRVAPLYHALPRVEDSMYKLGQSKVNLYSTFDNKGAFFSLPLAEESRDLTAISSSKYHLRYTRLPMGLKSSSSIYQLSLSNLLHSQLDTDFMVLYQDDPFCSQTVGNNTKH